ncbi:hypothetical protein [Dactylosporangium matsuzakiense]|nr:hypothetical protein [Dactylosporangium matsuzakiense]
MPAAVLARIHGLHISSATARQRATGGDRATYAAEAGRRHDRAPPTT